MITWASKRQPVTAISSTESEFYSVSQCALECVYLRRVMEIMGYKQSGPTLIAQDNNACIYLVKGSGMYNCAKHIDTRIYRIREFASGDNPTKFDENATNMATLVRRLTFLLRACQGWHSRGIAGYLWASRSDRRVILPAR